MATISDRYASPSSTWGLSQGGPGRRKRKLIDGCSFKTPMGTWLHNPRMALFTQLGVALIEALAQFPSLLKVVERLKRRRDDRNCVAGLLSLAIAILITML